MTARSGSTCPVCRRTFQHGGGRSPATCGRVTCRPYHDWGPDDWAGAARMARARQDAGAPLTALDNEALRRT